jgi:hypothetical protein
MEEFLAWLMTLDFLELLVLAYTCWFLFCTTMALLAAISLWDIL